MADITCPVCHSVNDAARTFCWKCASDLHAVVADPAAPPPPPKVVVPLQPIVIGAGVALAAIALIAVLVVLLSGTPAATMSPSGVPSVGPSAGAASQGAAGQSGVPTLVPATVVPPTVIPPTLPPEPTEAPAPTPRITTTPAPKIVSFKGPDTVDCSGGFDGSITLTWLIDNADGATISIDGPGIYQSYPGAQRSERFPFSCGNVQHTYTLTTFGGEGKAATKTLTIVENSGI
jgi:hypothetical protein